MKDFGESTPSVYTQKKRLKISTVTFSKTQHKKMPPQYKSKKSFKTARFEGFFAFISSKA